MAEASRRTKKNQRQTADSKPVDADAEIRAANQELELRVGSKLELPITLLFEQRNRALRIAQVAREQAQHRIEAMTEEQDRFIAFLMSDYESQVADMERRIRKAEEALERERKLVPKNLRLASTLVGTDDHLRGELNFAEERILELQEALEDAYREVDETRREVAQMEQERDDAIAEASDLRLAKHRALEAAQDEVARLTWQLDDARRRLEEERDDAREQAYRHNEQLSEIQRELDERNEQVHRLGAYVAELDHEVSCRPPPSAAAELEAARYEVHELRRQVIHARREQSRLDHELETARSGRTSSLPPRPLSRRPAVKQ
jgi:chromosome segregation ATPase